MVSRSWSTVLKTPKFFSCLSLFKAGGMQMDTFRLSREPCTSHVCHPLCVFPSKRKKAMMFRTARTYGTLFWGEKRRHFRTK